MSEQGSAAVATVVEEHQQSERKVNPKRQPRYNVILWDDDDHSYDYVVVMMKALFGHNLEMGFKIAQQVDASGRGICLTTTREHAELKRDQIHSYGKDQFIDRCQGSMSASIEPIPGE